jgi:UDP-N-acetylmuramoyl-tripeptide--D-alanyl-D-alanine ligase
MTIGVALLAGLGSMVAAVRWLRVLQREHYLPGSTGRFAVRWWTATPANASALTVAVLAAVAGVPIGRPEPGLVAVVVAAVGPIGLGLRGHTGGLAWTARLRRVAVGAGLIVSAALVVSGLVLPAVLGLVPLAVPLLVDAAAAVLAPVERRLGDRWVRAARDRLAASGATVVAITGSYGKTTTKGYVAHLIGGLRSVVATPASFNNRMGLARSVNEHLTPGTDVFVAEMGTYGVGEIAEMCAFVPPDVAVMTAIGSVHLERMRSEETIVRAKREILELARVAVLNVDHPGLARVAEEESSRRRVIRCSVVPDGGEVVADPGGRTVLVDGRVIGGFDPEVVHPMNLACAIGAVIGLGIDPADVVGRIPGLPTPPHRRTVGTSDRGVTVVDDTYNSNPTGARAALGLLEGLGAETGRRVLVTPGMVEMGPIQAAENERLAADAGRVVSDLVVVGRTNRRALLQGAEASGIGSVIVVGSREEAVAWVRSELGPGDAVLYENDLPDHYP